MAPTLEALIAKRTPIKAALTRAKTFYETSLQRDLDEGTTRNLESRLLSVVPLLDKFNDIMDEIEIQNLIDDAAMTAHITERVSFENNFYELKSNMEMSIAHFKSTLSASTATTSQGPIGSAPNVKLPVLKLPTFSGSYDQWSQFSETFNSLIHSNQTLDNVQKFHYLRSCLSGEAAATIEALDITSAKYDVAWNLLKERFENKRLAINKHVRAIFDIKPVSKESKSSLRTLLDTVLTHLRALSSLQEPVEQWDTLIIYLICTKLDPITRREWESNNNSTESPKFSDLTKLLRSKCVMLETLHFEDSHNESNHNRLKHSHNKHKSTINLATQQFNCSVCRGHHSIHTCEEFLNLPINARLAKVRELDNCTNCLGKGHKNHKCKSSHSCKKCQKRHHTLLHLEIANHPIEELTPIVELSNHSTSNSNQVLLSTAVVSLIDKHGRSHNCRVLLDSASQSNLITKKMFDLLELPTQNVNITIKGVNQHESMIKYRTDVRLHSHNSDFKLTLSCLIVPEITDNLPQISFNSERLNIPKNLRLADPTFNLSNKIDLLIGATWFAKLMSIGLIELGNTLPMLQKTKLGWVLSGPMPLYTFNTISPVLTNLNINLDTQICKFWELEEITNQSNFTHEEQACENHFLSTTKRNTDGRFIVNIPLRDSADVLGDSKAVALKRFYSLERKLDKNPQLKESYSKFLQEYEELGHMTEVQKPERTAHIAFYMPHHPVIKEDSTSTKLRVVFDGSAKSDSSISVNSLQMVGPTIQRDLFSILLRFRRHPIVLTADISKMYRQVLIDPDQRSLQRILWREGATDELKTYNLNTVTYGTASAPFLAIRCLKQLADDHSLDFPSASAIIENDFYVDDLITGGESVEQVIQIRNDVEHILHSAGFELHKWASNNVLVLDDISERRSNDPIIEILDSPERKTLGVKWNPTRDTFHYAAKPYNHTRVTKRTILSAIAQIFDPLGLIAPIVVVAKLIMQSLWQERLHWDESIPSNIFSKWRNFIDQLNQIDQISPNRYVMCNNYSYIELHGFCDASEAAYGACLYIRSVNHLGTVNIELLCAKSKVAPLKNISIPKLELCGALLLSNLMSKAKATLELEFANTFCWCDSTIVLHWINSPSNKWKTFVANRVSQIQTMTVASDWRHIRTHDNPADLISRGTTVEGLHKSKLWWSGPHWLTNNQNEWPAPFQRADIDLPEARKIENTLILTANFDIFSRFSDFNKLIRVVAYCLRFKFNSTHSREHRRTGSLTTPELINATHSLIKMVQTQAFHSEIKDLKTNKPIKNKSSLRSLTPIIDDSQIIRVGGRLQNSNLTFGKKHPIILPSKHKFTQLLIKAEHVRQLHCGTEALLASIRERYWPISGRNLCRRVVHECVKCFKAKPPKSFEIMGNLPASRVNPAPPFHICGVDYAGPFSIKDRQGRGSKVSKAYLCVFLCFTTKALHLELVSDLSTNSFVATFRRFVSRRGKPQHIYSDNGTNFTGADSELKELYKFINDEQNQNAICNVASQENVTWHFIPPRSPHFGGLWEAGVKSVKRHLKRVISNALLTYEGMLTCLTQIEAVLNSRPLSSMSSDPNDLEALTPSHFLIGRRLTGLPDPSVIHIPENRLSIYQRMQQLVQHFWRRWSKEYITQLQQRNKWQGDASSTLHENDLVLLRDDNLAALSWRLGRIIAIHPGHDGKVRVVTVKTASGTFKRSVTSVCAFPTDSQ